jgi:hypothetical protein
MFIRQQRQQQRGDDRGGDAKASQPAGQDSMKGRLGVKKHSKKQRLLASSRSPLSSPSGHGSRLPGRWDIHIVNSM